MPANLRAPALVPSTVHYFMAGLRFEGLWRHAVRRTPGGRLAWLRLPCEEHEAAVQPTADPEGAWWCARRCVAVLGQLPWNALSSWDAARDPSPAPVPLALALEQALPASRAQILPPPKCQAWALEGVLESGGGLLVRLHRQGAMHWVWVVGAERRGCSQSLLVVAPPWLAPWGCGYGARLRIQRQGRWALRGTDGQRLEGLGLEGLSVLPRGPYQPSR